MRAIALLALCFAAVAAFPSSPDKIAGGNFVNISKYPASASITITWNGVNYIFHCAGTIINNVSILTAAHCLYYSPVQNFRVRVGSANVNSGGVVHNVNNVRYHPNFSDDGFDYDIGLLRTSSAIYRNNNIRPASIAGSGYTLGDNQAVWATGWRNNADSTDTNLRQLADSQLWTINKNTCNSRYSSMYASITDDMVCTGWPNQNNNGQCNGVFGAGVYHSGVLVGVTTQCFSSRPTINTRVSSFSSWIQANA